MRFSPTAASGSGICIQKQPLSAKAARQKAKAVYSQNRQLLSPVLGEIELTQLGWRHMFRKSRRSDWKCNSSAIIPYLPLLVPRIPDEHFVTSCVYTQARGITVRSADHVLGYQNVAYFDPGGKRVIGRGVVRLQESVRYPSDWDSRSALSRQVQRRVVLISAYLKTEV